MFKDLSIEKAASTVSMIVTHNEKGLYLIKRKHEPFKEMWALPGGTHNYGIENLEETAVRELKKETSLNTTVEDLLLIGVYSNPDRDPREHIINHVYLVLDYTGDPKTKDDAKEIKYFEYSDLPEIAFDHKKSIDKYFNHFRITSDRIKDILNKNNSNWTKLRRHV